jgi:hypothetical protein
MRIENTVFISYRRTDVAWALNVNRDLVWHGYDVFLDVRGIASGDFERVILQNIRGRAHFVVLLTPSALDGCKRPEDWLRREIEAALEARRNIIPLMLEGFDFRSQDVLNRLTGKLTALRRYNALEIPAGYFDEAMDRLRRDWLNIPLEAVPLHPVSSDVQHATEQEQQVASKVSPELLTQVLRLAEVPLFNDEEQAFYETLAPEHQVIMTLQARRSREILMTSLLNHVLNLRAQEEG